MFFFQELETRIETQKQTLQARDESIKKLLEMLQSKGDGKFIDILVLLATTSALIVQSGASEGRVLTCVKFNISTAVQ